MLFHVSIEADHPEHVATVIAEFWRGKAMPFPGVIEGSWIALAGDEKNSAIEVYPRGTEVCEGQGPAFGRLTEKRGGTASHVAVASVLSVEELFAIGKREGWHTKIARPGDAFSFVEFWIEGHQCFEVFAPEQQQEYLDRMTIPAYEAAIEGWLKMRVIARNRGDVETVASKA